uniref:Uncharacterized protein n=1 Tax=Anguilla anguilla TaxID=7936 RepID=A0A0E9WRW4_ANGAN
MEAKTEKRGSSFGNQCCCFFCLFVFVYVLLISLFLPCVSLDLKTALGSLVHLYCLFFVVYK